jgi:hypothetical protein
MMEDTGFAAAFPLEAAMASADSMVDSLVKVVIPA